MQYEYLCGGCFAFHEAERPCKERNTVPCPHCDAPPEDQQIQLQSVAHKSKVTPTLMTEGAAVEKYGPAWRETDASNRMKRGEPSDGKSYLIPGLKKGDTKTTGAP
jgi:hypothetical protein